MGYTEHQARIAVEAPESLRCGVITASDSRTPETDVSGRIIREKLAAAGHDVVQYAVERDEAARIAALVRRFVDSGCQVIIINGGTGIAKRDSTFEAVDSLLEKRLPGFGELFRMLSYQEIGPAAMLSRATAGVTGGALLFSLPGSPNAVTLALDKLILPELRHLVWETTRH
ncbi:MAG: molybdenum cofactor biosynthesis protein B [Dehalococcoidia bacterium]|nr:MAG: molybdenum cofactor biosynthesis protein B [Dehalococcoidia bacterium]